MPRPGGTRLGLALVLAAARSWAVANLIVTRMRGGTAARPSEPLAIVIWGSAARIGRRRRLAK
ncbi:MAG: hypothetical protein ACK5WG_13230 [Betaproteobacteria bacterium]